MLQELGFVVETPRGDDEITSARLDEVATSVLDVGRETRPFDIGLTSVNAFHDAVFLEMTRGAVRSTKLHERLREVATVIGDPRYPYLPHVTIAHFTAEAPIGDLPERLASWRGERFGGFKVTAIEIVTLSTDESYPPLETYVRVPLLG
jgi:2'-5' RNA ligase